MGAITPILGLYKPGGGSTGTITPDETADIDRLNENFDAIDEWAGTVNEKTTIATNSEIDAGTNNTHIVTPAGLKRGSPYLGLVIKSTGSNTVTSGTTEEVISGFSLVVTTPRAGHVRLSGLLTAYASDVNAVMVIRIKEGSTIKAEFTTRVNSYSQAAGSSQYQAFSVVLPGVTKAEHTYTLAVARAEGTGTVTVTPTTLTPIQLTAEMMN